MSASDAGGAEHAARHNRRLTRLLRTPSCELRTQASKTWSAPTPRGLEKAMVRQLAHASWVNATSTCSSPGRLEWQELPSECDRTRCLPPWLRVLYRRVPRLFEELGLAKASGTYAKTRLRRWRARTSWCSMIWLSRRSRKQSE